MNIRSGRERLLQTVSFELGGIVLATPLYMAVSGAPASEGAALVTALAVVVAFWTLLHNWAFDVVEWRLAARVASDRPQVWRVVHAVSHEVTSLVVTVPVILWMTDYGVIGAVLLDLGLTVFYVGYAYVFHVVYDRLRPVQRSAA